MDRYIDVIVRSFSEPDQITGRKGEEFNTKGNVDLDEVVMYYETHDDQDEPTGVSMDFRKGGGVSITMKYAEFHRKITEYRHGNKIDEVFNSILRNG